MTGGQIAGLIAAIAFLVLVVFIGVFLMKMVRTLGEVNQSVKTMTNDMDVIAKQTEDILASANTLLDDVNHKVATIDPVFQAAADLGTSVSDLNAATRDLTGKVKSTAKKTATTSVVTRVGESVFKAYRNRKNKV
ncbi:methyl-accepting chemotaxis-like protein [Secundilactobacillus odoratitofui DSM 19909 = JCM 15043]|uniref:Methyl-accepting chemotaxis-like protein n=1 Tax=Secundilactobacillus odoratitofui DSM 19909 = JCM 15043 TaxID=1423776 RepID=A0A0R1LVP1_9LACO|nr:DUF948 domain-containing protein [Secundilactobacillus odoratitofui]KRK97252.1 methyl-accepting chemotaxis-like protein [Secundilactobacillus odoratitofui DSM 19909 = JCM 15043]